MTNGYAKIFSSILASSIWAEDDRTRLVWITMLVMSDENGTVRSSVPGLAHMARVPIADCEVAIRKFLSPDPHTLTAAHEGRRIEALEGGWRLLNHEKYKLLMGAEERRAYWRQKKRQSKLEYQKANENVTGRAVVNQLEAEKRKQNLA